MSIVELPLQFVRMTYQLFFPSSKLLALSSVYPYMCVRKHTCTYCTLYAWQYSKLMRWNSSTLQNNSLFWVRLWTQKMASGFLPSWDRSRITGEPFIEPSQQLRMNLPLVIVQKMSLRRWETVRVSFIYTMYCSQGKYHQWLFRNGNGSTVFFFKCLALNIEHCTPKKGFYRWDITSLSLSTQR